MLSILGTLCLKRYVQISLATIPLLSALGVFGFLRSLAWEDLIIGATQKDSFILPPSLFKAYIDYNRPILSSDRTDMGLTPTAYLINGCSGRWSDEANCKPLLTSLTTSHDSVNTRSDDKYGFAPMHLAVLYRDDELLTTLMSLNANTSIEATGTSFESMTPHALAELLAGRSNDEAKRDQWLDIAKRLEP